MPSEHISQPAKQLPSDKFILVEICEDLGNIWEHLRKFRGNLENLEDN